MLQKAISHILHRSHRYIRVCVVGLMSLAIQLVLFNLLRLAMGPTLANTIAIECAIINNFFMNNYFTFQDRQFAVSVSWPVLRSLIVFNLYSLCSLIIQGMIVFLGTHVMQAGLLLENGLVIVGIVLGSIINYFIYSRIIWKSAS